MEFHSYVCNLSIKRWNYKLFSSGNGIKIMKENQVNTFYVGNDSFTLLIVPDVNMICWKNLENIFLLLKFQFVSLNILFYFQTLHKEGFSYAHMYGGDLPTVGFDKISSVFTFNQVEPCFTIISEIEDLTRKFLQSKQLFYLNTRFL